LCQAIAVLARAHQDAIWRRTTAHHQLRSLLREFYPTFLATFSGRFALGIASPEARALVAIASTPAAAAKLSVSRIAAALRRAGRSRGIAKTAAEIKAELRKSQLRQPVLVETAMGRQTLALLAALDTACSSVEDLGQAAAELFQQHPDHAIITSFPGLADSTGARVLAEIGDDRARFADARALKAYAGSAPITRASGHSIFVTHRHIKNNRLANVGWMCAFSAASTASLPGSITANGGKTATATPPPTAICSTNSSASSTTAYNTGRASPRPRHSRHRYATRPSARHFCPRS
jgi:hypothetical protein